MDVQQSKILSEKLLISYLDNEKATQKTIEKHKKMIDERRLEDHWTQ